MESVSSEPAKSNPLIRLQTGFKEVKERTGELKDKVDLSLNEGLKNMKE